MSKSKLPLGDSLSDIHRHRMNMRRPRFLTGHHQKMQKNPFSDEKHSLQGKSGKTHAVC